jgi:hypothetical protein
MAKNAFLKAARDLEKAQVRAAKEEARRLKEAQREEARRIKEEQRELAWRAAEAEKAAARAEVEASEREIELLRSWHKLRPRPFSWSAQHFSLPPHPPAFHAKNHLRETAETLLLTREYENLEERLAVAWSKDESAYYESYKAYEESYGRWQRLKLVAQRLRAGDAGALGDAHAELEGQGILYGSAAEMVLQACDSKRMYVATRVEGRDVIPTEVKTLTQADKVATRSMPKSRAKELYEDYVCSRCLAMGRRLFASLPLTEIIITAYAPSRNASTGNQTDVPVLSVHFEKKIFLTLNLDALGPVEAINKCRLVGKLSDARRGEEFMPVQPLAFAEAAAAESPADEVQTLTAMVATLRGAFRKYQNKGGRAGADRPATEEN